MIPSKRTQSEMASYDGSWMDPLDEEESIDDVGDEFTQQFIKKKQRSMTRTAGEVTNSYPSAYAYPRTSDHSASSYERSSPPHESSSSNNRRRGSLGVNRRRGGGGTSGFNPPRQQHRENDRSSGGGRGRDYEAKLDQYHPGDQSNWKQVAYQQQQQLQQSLQTSRPPPPPPPAPVVKMDVFEKKHHQAFIQHQRQQQHVSDHDHDAWMRTSASVATTAAAAVAPVTDFDEDQPIGSFMNSVMSSRSLPSQHVPPPPPSTTASRGGFQAPRRIHSAPPLNPFAPPTSDSMRQPLMPLSMNYSNPSSMHQLSANSLSNQSLAPHFSPVRPNPKSVLVPAKQPSSAPAPSTTSSNDCLLRFYPPAYFQQFGMNRLPNFHLNIQPESITVTNPDTDRKIKLESIFTSPDSFADFFTKCICQELQGRLNKVSADFTTHYQAFQQVKNQMNRNTQTQQQQQLGFFGTASNTSNFIPSGGTTAPGPDIERYLRSKGLHYYDSSSIELSAFNSKQFWKNCQRKAKREAEFRHKKKQAAKRRKIIQKGGGEYEEDEFVFDEDEDGAADDDDAHISPEGFKHYLTLKNLQSKERPSSYSDGDLWICSSDPTFNLVRRGQSTTTVNSFFPTPIRDHFVLFLQGRWHGFSSKRSQLKVTPIPLHPTNINTKLMRAFQSEHTRIYCLRLSDFQSDCTMLELLNSQSSTGLNASTTTLRSMPLLPFILHGAHWKQFQSHYHLTTGVWLTDAERSDQERKKFQSMKQSTLMDIGRKTTAPAHQHMNFVPLSDPATHLLASVPILKSMIDDIKADIYAHYALNDDQSTVLEHVADWFWTRTEQSPPTDSEDAPIATSSTTELKHEPTSSPIQLVHGCFGSGKSWLLVVLIIFLTRVFDTIDPERKIKIMIASLTNVAVDGILFGLQKENIDFIRVGSIRRVMPPIIRHMVHMSSGKGSEEEAQEAARRELREMIARMDQSVGDGETPINPNDKLHYQQALDELNVAKKRQRKKRLEHARVIGLTVAACDFELLTSESNLRCPIVFLDEASQMTEPASLIPIARFKAERVLAVGDPKQLGPTLPGTDMADTQQQPTLLARTMFVRLQDAGIPTTLLRTQYRMHPVLAKIPNQLFYENRLMDGVTPEIRFPLLVPHEGTNSPSLAPLNFVNVANGVEMSGSFGESDSTGGSKWNPQEVDAIAQIVRVLLIHGIEPSQIGVIAPFRAQAAKIQAAVHNLIVIPTVKQPILTAPVKKKKQPKQPTPRKSKSNQANGISAKAEFREILKKQVPSAVSSTPSSSNESSEFGQPDDVPLPDEAQSVTGVSVQVSTVDAFQGAEKDFILFSCVRSHDSTTFVDIPTRLNVSITRAKHHLIIVGKKATLDRSESFKVMTAACMKTPGAFSPNINDFIQRISKLQINPKLLEVKPTMTEMDSDATTTASHPSAVSFRNLAREYQSNTSVLATSLISHAPATPTANDSPENEYDFDDDFLVDDDEDEEEEKRPTKKSQQSKKRKEPPTAKSATTTNTSGLSPYSIAHANELPDSDESDNDDPEAKTDEVDLDDSITGVTSSIEDLLQSDRERQLAAKRAAEQNRPIEHDDEGESEMTFEPLPLAPVSSNHSNHDAIADGQDQEMVQNPSSSPLDELPSPPQQSDENGGEPRLTNSTLSGPSHHARHTSASSHQQQPHPSSVHPSSINAMPPDFDDIVPMDILPERSHGRRMDEVEVRSKRK